MSPRVSEDFITLISESLQMTARRCLLKPIALHASAGFDLKHSEHISSLFFPEDGGFNVLKSQKRSSQLPPLKEKCCLQKNEGIDVKLW